MPLPKHAYSVSSGAVASSHQLLLNGKKNGMYECPVLALKTETPRFVALLPGSSCCWLVWEFGQSLSIGGCRSPEGKASLIEVSAPVSGSSR